MWMLPRLGTEVELISDISVNIHWEDRNRGALCHLLNKNIFDKDIWKIVRNNPGGKKSKVTIPAGTKLIVDRIYVRSGGRDFDSISFRMPLDKPVMIPYRQWDYGLAVEVVKFKKARVIRFWLKLEDVRKMDVKELKY